jgi:acetylornithine deacetylase/succinyl-diaminopimelate desuccinylase family protein
MMDAIQLLRDMIAIPSVNPMRSKSGEPVEREMANYLESVLRQAGIDCERQNVTEGRDNVMGIVHATGKSNTNAGLMFNSHMDTVPVANMTIDPFDPVIKDGCVFGRGACDAKGSIAAMLMSVIKYANQPERPTEVIFAAMADEEFSFSGSWKLIQKQWPVSSCVVGEPTKLARVVAHKGIVRWHANVQGLSAHGATPERGRNAIYDGARLALALEEYSKELEGRETHPLLGHSTINVGRVDGGQSVNIVPDFCRSEIELRLLPGEDGRRAVDNCLSFLNKRLGDSVEFSFEDPYLIDPAMETSSGAQVVKALGAAQEVELGSACAIEGGNYGTDGSKLSMVGIETVVCGPGDIAHAHTRAEFVEIKQIELATRMYGQMLSQWANH